MTCAGCTLCTIAGFQQRDAHRRDELRKNRTTRSCCFFEREKRNGFVTNWLQSHGETLHHANHNDTTCTTVAPIAKTLGVLVTLCHHLYMCSGTQSRRTAISLGDIRCDAPVLLDDKTRMRCNLCLSLHNAKLPESKRAKRNRSSSASTATFLGFHRSHPSSTKKRATEPTSNFLSQ